MIDKDPVIISSHDAVPNLRFEDGWREILEASDAIDYQVWLDDLADLSLGQLSETVTDKDAVMRAWQIAVEQVADVAIDPEELPEMTEADIVETALITLKMNVDSMGWDEEGIVFTVPNMFSGEEATIDLRELI